MRSRRLPALFVYFLVSHLWIAGAALSAPTVPQEVAASLAGRSAEIAGEIVFDPSGTPVLCRPPEGTAVPLHPVVPSHEGDASLPDDLLLTPQWNSLRGPYGGYVSGLTIDPFDHGRVYAGTQGGGVYRSTNSGTEWRDSRVGMMRDWAAQIDVDPLNLGVVYAAAQSYWIGTYGQGSIFKSTDAGRNWTDVSPSAAVWNAVWADRSLSGVVLAGGTGGIYRSTDGGASWTYTGRSGTVLEFQDDPSDHATIYAGTYGYRIFRSTDHGLTWTVIGGGIPNGNIRSIAVSPTSSLTVYAAAYDALAGGTQGIYRSLDGGATWVHVLTQNTWRVRVDPTNALNIWAAADGPMFSGIPGLYKSTDSGTTWSSITLPTSSCYASFAYQLAIHPDNGQEVFVGLYRAGVLKTLDGGLSWVATNTGLASDNVLDMDAVFTSPTDLSSVVLYAGTEQADLWKTTDGGLSWFWSASGFTETNRTVESVAVDPSLASHVLMGGSGSGVWQSTDSGASWTATSLQSNSEVADLAFSPSDPTQVWAGVTNASSTLGIWKSTDSGVNWVRKESGRACTGVAVHPTDPNIIYASVETFTGSDHGGILKSTDGGSTWSMVYDEGAGTVLYDVAIDPVTPATVYACSYTNNVVKSTDGGATWTPNLGGFDPGGRIMTIQVDPLNHDLVWAGVSDNKGAFLSTDGGLTWAPHNAGLWNRTVQTLKVFRDGTERRQFAGTLGCSAYEWGEPIASGVAFGEAKVAVSILHQNVPNPFSRETTIGFDLSRSCLVDLGVFDCRGRLVRRLAGGLWPAGGHVIVWDGRNDSGRSVVPGIYFAHLEADGYRAATRMVVVRIEQP